MSQMLGRQFQLSNMDGEIFLPIFKKLKSTRKKEENDGA